MNERPWFGRDPSLWSQAILAVLAMGQMLVPGLPDTIVAVVGGVVAAAASTFTALHVRPLAPSLFTGLIATLAPLVAYFGIHATQAQIGAIQLALAGVLGLMVRSASTPTWDPVNTTAVVAAGPLSR